MTGPLGAALVQHSSRRKPSNLELWYDKPAARWVEALPVGNGQLAAMVFGRVAQERLQLNEGTLWAGSPYDPVNPQALGALGPVRQLIDQGRFQEAQDLASQSIMAKPLSQMPYGTAGDLLLDFAGLAFAGDYRRSLDLSGAVARTSFRLQGGTHTREVFVSEPDQVMVVRLLANGSAKLDFDIAYRPAGPATYDSTRYQGPMTPAEGLQPDWEFREPLQPESRPPELVIVQDGPLALLITNRNVASAGVPAGLKYAVRVAVRGNGRITVEGDKIVVRSSSLVTLVISAATSFISPARTDGDPVREVRARTEGAVNKSYAELRSRHTSAYRRLFERFSISVGKPSPRAKDTTDRRIVHVDENTGALAALYIQYARYLMLSSSRGTGQPANLQGIWNEGTNPPWGSKYTININTEMNYWPVDPFNVSECYEPLIRMVEELALTGAHTAKTMYGARGWVAHHNTDLWRATAPVDGPFWGLWPMGGAWLCNTLWDHYDYLRDPVLLQRIYPLLKGASLFFADTLVEDPMGRGLVTSPSLSPENAHHDEVSLCAGPAMDRQILRDLFDRTLKAQKLTGDPDTEFAGLIAAKRSRLPQDRIGAQGQLQEWLDDWDAGAPEQRHRHVSHLYGVYPSDQINLRDTPGFVAAAKVSLDARGDISTGWATAWRLCLWARMGEGERAYRILQGLLGPQRTYTNLFDAHPPFQIDGNFGGSAGILEMIAQSWGDEVRILPALPRSWTEGSVTGLKVRGGAELSLRWKNGELRSLRLKGPPGAEIRVRYRDTLKILKFDAAGQSLWARSGPARQAF